MPIAIEGSGFVLPVAGFKVRAGRIRLRAGTPIATFDLHPDDRQQLARRSQQAIIDLQRRE